jgi:hypothetical protein
MRLGDEEKQGKFNIPPPLLFSFSWVLIDDTDRSPTGERRTQERRNQQPKRAAGWIPRSEEG